ncbi:MAG: hypothetical protein ACRD2W_04205 [Acidimicrobiales bacterium]
MRSLVDAVPSVAFIIVGVGGVVGLTLLGVLAARKLFPNLAEGPFDEMADGLRVVYELVFALILAFVIASVLDTFATAEGTVAAEATTLAEIKRSNFGLPVEQQVVLDEGLDHYLHAVVEDEWDLMRSGRESPRAAAALQTLYALYQSYSPPPAEGPEAEFYREAISHLADATASRRERLQLSRAELPGLLRLFLPLGAVLLLVLEFRPKIARRAQLIHMGLLAAIVAFSYLLTILLDYPFVGDVSVSSEPFKEGALAEFWWDETPHVLAPGETVEPLMPEALSRVWTSPTFGVIAFRQVGDEVHGVYRITEGTVVGRVGPDGVYRGWWCQSPTRQATRDAGEVEWRLVRSSDGRSTIYGSWRYGTTEQLQGGWDLQEVGGPEPPDIARGFGDPTRFCRRP